MKITWFGTASLAVQGSAGRLLVDPYFPMKGSPTRVPADAYDGYSHILVTHGHFDHIESLPGIVARTGAMIHCTQTPFRTLRDKGVPEAQLTRFAPGDSFSLEGMRVTAFQGRHVKYDGKLLRRTFLNLRMLRYIGNMPRLIREFRGCPENGETMAFLIECDGQRVLAMGSLNLDDATEYPTDVGLLVLPYQGTSDLLTPGLQIIERLKPRAVLLDHFDDAFPPISGSVDTSDIQSALAGKLPVYRLEPGQTLEL